MATARRPLAALHLTIALLGAAALVWGARLGGDALLDRLRPLPPAATTLPAPVEEDPAAVRRARLQREEEALAAERTRREQQRAAVLEAREQAVAADQAERAHKQAAWEKFYRRPRKCEAPPDNATLVECSNHYLREQQRFEKAYAAGRL